MNNTEIIKELKKQATDLMTLAKFLHEGMNLLNQKIELLTKDVERLKNDKLL